MANEMKISHWYQPEPVASSYCKVPNIDTGHELREDSMKHIVTFVAALLLGTSAWAGVVFVGVESGAPPSF